jgi:hypothetical protein
VLSLASVPSNGMSKTRCGRCLKSPNPLMNLGFDVPKLDETRFRLGLRALAMAMSYIA